jgi:NAD(P)-dependent dehydrogenase (short-subunit alcohol dehydrogenase family)
MSGRLEGKIALITGSTSGIGRATAKLFAAQGARVVVNGRRGDWGNSLVEEIASAGGQAAYFNADLSQSQAVRDLVRFTVRTFGRIDVLVNNAFYRVMGTAVDLAEADWDRSMAVTLKAPYIACQEAIPHMIRQGGGSIINVASVQAFTGARRFFVYAIAKAGMLNMVRQIAVDFGPQGIRANAVCPGTVIVERNEDVFTAGDATEAQTILAHPIRRVARGIDIAYAALYLASDEARCVTGTTLVVDGGSTCQGAGGIREAVASYYDKK